MKMIIIKNIFFLIFQAVFEAGPMSLILNNNNILIRNKTCVVELKEPVSRPRVGRKLLFLKKFLFPEVLTNSLDLKKTFGAFDHTA